MNSAYLSDSLGVRIFLSDISSLTRHFPSGLRFRICDEAPPSPSPSSSPQPRAPSVLSSPSFFLHPTSMLHPLRHSENLTQRQIQFALVRPSAGGIKSGKEEERREGIAAVMRLAKGDRGGRGSQLQRKRVFSRDVAYATTF